LNSIFRKLGKINTKVKVDYNHLSAPIEIQLVKDLVVYPEKILESLRLNDPSVVTQYLFNLAQDFNAFYHELPVLKAKLDVQAARLELLKAIRQVLENSMTLLGLERLSEM
jgi:arginyl-tRNA synthetase